MTLTPLDPNEGPTLWIEIKEAAENPRIQLLAGESPESPFSSVTINERELREALRQVENAKQD
jgi:hypothetical protein